MAYAAAMAATLGALLAANVTLRGLWLYGQLLILSGGVWSFYCVCTHGRRLPGCGMQLRWHVVAHLVVVTALLVGCNLLLKLALPFQVPILEYAMDLGAVNGSSPFFRMRDARLRYHDDVREISAAVNGARAGAVQDLPVSGVVIWNSDALRFDFLLRYWESDRFRAPYACIMESDVVVDAAYFEAQLAAARPDLAWVQHMHQHRNFEAYNFGVLCAAKDASWATRVWVRAMRYLHHTTWRRLLHYPLLFLLLPGRGHVFEWRRDGGCTLLAPGCRYVHFTHPKLYGIELALNLVRGSAWAGGGATNVTSVR